ncbi:MAG: Ig-like domain-containing protein [Lachnospiraceae bacterium]|nr:Ig-like domain-containing protein [Lachnospiraceae bacterium]
MKKKKLSFIKSLGLIVTMILALSFTVNAKASESPASAWKFVRASRVLYVNANNPLGVPTEFQFEVEGLPENYASLYSLNYSSENTEVATVDANGLAKAVGLGTTRINLEIKDKSNNKTVKSLRGVIKVNENAKGIVIENENEITTANFYVGDTRELKVALLNQKSQMSHDDGFVSDIVGFMSNNKDVVDIDKNGKMTVMGAGKAVITAYTFDPAKEGVHTSEKKLELNIESLALDFSMKVSACDGFVLSFSENVSANDVLAGGKLYKISSPDFSYQSQGIGAQIEIPYTIDYIDGRNVYIKTSSMLDVSTYYIFNFRNTERNVKADYGTPKTAKLTTKETVLANRDHKLYLQLLDSNGVDVTAKYYDKIYSVLIEKRVGNSNSSEYVYEIGKDGLIISEFVTSPCTIEYSVSALYVGNNADSPLLEAKATIDVTKSYTPEIPSTDVVMNGNYWSAAANGVGNIEMSNSSASLYCDLGGGYDEYTIFVRITDKNGLPYVAAEPEVVCKNEASKNDTCIAPDAIIDYISDGLYSVRFIAMGINSIRMDRPSETWEYLITINGVSSSVFTLNCYKGRTVTGTDLKRVDASFKFSTYDIASVDSISFSLNDYKGSINLGESGDSLYPMPANRSDYVASDNMYFYSITKDGKDVTTSREVTVAGSRIILPLYEEKIVPISDCKNSSISDLILSGSFDTVASFADYSGEGYGAGEYKVSIWQIYDKNGTPDKKLVSSKTITVTDNTAKYTLANTYAKAPCDSSMMITDMLFNKFDLRMDGKKLTSNDLQIENLGLSYALLADNKGIYIRKISLVVYDAHIQANRMVEFEVSDYIYTK